MAPISGKSFLAYVLAMDHAFGTLLYQNNEQGHEQTIHYISRTMIGVEHQYNRVEKKCLAMVFALQKM